MPFLNPHIVNPDQGELKRGEASLLKFLPPPLLREGDKVGWVAQ